MKELTYKELTYIEKVMMTTGRVKFSESKFRDKVIGKIMDTKAEAGDKITNEQAVNDVEEINKMMYI